MSRSIPLAGAWGIRWSTRPCTWATFRSRASGWSSAEAVPILTLSKQPAPEPGDWDSIAFTDTSADATFDGAGNYTGGSILQHCTVKYSGSEGNDTSVAIYAKRARPWIDNCTIAFNQRGGVLADALNWQSPQITISSNHVHSNQGWGIEVDRGIIKGNTVSSNTYGINLLLGSMASGNTVRDNIYWGLNAQNRSTIVVRENTGRSIGGVRVTRSTVARNQISENVAGKTGDTEAIGGLYADRESLVMSNTITANTVLARSGPSGAEIKGIAHHNTIVGNRGPTGPPTGGVLVNGKEAAPHHNNIDGNQPFDLSTGRGSTFEVSGTLNYWGTVEMAHIVGQVYDWHDDSELYKLLFAPYLQDLDPLAPVPPPLSPGAVWGEGMVTLSWEPIPSAEGGYSYRVHYDTDEAGPPYDGTGLDQGDSPIDVGDASQIALSGLEASTPYYFAVTAQDTGGRAGWYSVAVDNQAALSRVIYLPIVVKE